MANNSIKITEKKPCFECGNPAECFGWEPAHMIYCRKCSPTQKQRVKFERLEELKDAGLDVALWGWGNE